MKDDYSDILHLPHHVSSVHPQMPVSARAAQFAPFAALTGHGAAIAEAARLTEARPALGEQEKEELNRRLLLLKNFSSQHPELKITYFIPDARKAGGRICRTAGLLKKIDVYRRLLLLASGTAIPFADILQLESDITDAAMDKRPS